MATLLLSVMGAFAEFERALIGERQRDGIALAKQCGVYRGRKKALSAVQRAELRQRLAAGEQKARVAREFGISREMLYQYLRPMSFRTFLSPFLPAAVAPHVRSASATFLHDKEVHDSICTLDW